MTSNTPTAIREALRLGAPAKIPVTLFGAGQWSAYQAGRAMRDLATDPDLMTDTVLATQKKVTCRRAPPRPRGAGISTGGGKNPQVFRPPAR